MITREADYAIRVLVALARRHSRTPSAVPVSLLAAELDIPYRFLRKLTKKMVARNLVESRRGRGGGLVLGRSPRRLSLYQAVSAMAPLSATLSPCLVGEGFCTRNGHCTVHRELRRIQNGVDRELKRLTLDRLLA
jgi:Rrf2 family iron-sulfur cluster assembly transcriptional regulator